MVCELLCIFAGNYFSITKPQMTRPTSTNIFRKGRIAVFCLIVCALLPLRSYSSAFSSLGVLTTEDGLSSNSVKTIYRDKTGYMYFGTSTGVDRYDGTNIVNIAFPIERKSEKCWVSGIVDAGGDKLYVGNNVGLYVLDKRTLSMTPAFGDIIDCEVTGLLRAPDSKIYVATVNGLYVISGGRAEDGGIEPLRLGAIRNFTERNIRDIALLYDKRPATKKNDTRYTICAITPRSLILLPHGEVRRAAAYQKPQSCGDTRFVKVAASRGCVYIGTAGRGVLPFDTSDRSFRTSIMDGNSITDLQASADSLYVSTAENGTVLLATSRNGENSVLRYFAPPDMYNVSAPTTATRQYGAFCFLHDDMGIDWTGYLFFGIDYTSYSYRIFSKYLLPGVPADEILSVQNILFDGGRTFLCTRNGLYVGDSITNTTRYIGKHVLGTKMVSDIRIVPHGYLVHTIGNGILLLDRKTLAVKPVEGSRLLDGSYVYLSAEDGKGNIWLATTKGAACYNPQTNSIKVYNSRNSQLPDDEVFCLNFDISGRGWFSTRGGLCCFDPATSTVTTSNMPKTLTELGEMRKISRWADGSMCFLPQHGFPVVSDASVSTFKHIHFDIHEENISINFFLRHKDMYIFSTENGLYSVLKGKCRFYGHITDIGGGNMSAKSPFVDNRERLWICTNEGAYFTDVNSLRRTDYIHLPIVVSEIQSDHWFTDSEVSVVVHDNLLPLSRHSSDLRLKFSPLVFGNTRDLRYRYRLEGVDRDWRISDNSRTIFYHNIPFGSHHLRIEVLGMPEISADIVIDVPMTYYAISVIILAILLLALISHVVYCKIYKKEYLWKRLLPKPEKYQTSRLEKKEGERLAKALLAIMNDKKPYLDANIQMSDFAKMLGCSTHTLSQVFTLFVKRNYYDFIAEYRIEEFKRLSRDPKYAKYTITALSNLCGFRSRTPFLAAFKKYTDMTPKEWMKTVSS